LLAGWWLNCGTTHRPSRDSLRLPLASNVKHQMSSPIDPVKLRRLLDELCVDLGFCMATRETDRLSASAMVGVNAFTDSILVIEGLDPQLHKQLRVEVRGRVEKHFHAWSASHDV
jgi:hypothetical protein